MTFFDRHEHATDVQVTDGSQVDSTITQHHEPPHAAKQPDGEKPKKSPHATRLAR
jgi:hypothetical protein